MNRDHSVGCSALRNGVRCTCQIAPPLPAAGRASRAEEVARLREALVAARRFIDYTVREWLPREHTSCGIDRGCAHGVRERDAFQQLDDAVDAMTTALHDREEKT